MEIKFIGTGSIATKCTSYLINGHILFDCGFGTVQTLRDAGLDEKVDTVIISHLHPDHAADLIYLILTCFVKKRPGTSLRLIAPTGTRQFIENLNHATFSGDLNDNLDAYFAYFQTVLENLVELADGQSLQTEQLTIQAFRVSHGAANSNGYLLKLGDLTLGCTGDTGFCPALANNIPKAPIWVIDASHQQGLEHERHLSLENIVALAQQYPQTRFYAVHRRHYPTVTTCDNIFFPTDGESVTL